MSKKFWLVLIVVIVGFGVIFKLTDKKTPASSNSSNTTQPSEHIQGQGKDSVTLLEYGDYQCPYCEEYYPIVKQVAAQYATQIFFQFRNLPLTELHQNAFAAARAAEAASLQDQFWQMHDALYDTQENWVNSNSPETYFISLAQQLNLNVSKFKSDYSSDQVNNIINADVNAFGATGQQEATPSFFLDGTFIQPGPTVASFDQYINAEIAKKTGKSAPTPPVPSTGNQSVQPTTTTTK